MKKLIWLSLLVLACAVGVPASAADVAADTAQAPVVAAAPAPAADAPMACTADADAVDTSLDALLETAPAQAEACYPNECPCPTGFRCRYHCCV